MDSRSPSDVQTTGTLPLSGEEAVPVAAPGRAASERPEWLVEARDGLTAVSYTHLTLPTTPYV